MSRENDYRVAVAVAHPERAAQLTRTAVDVARDAGGEVLVLSVVVTQRQSPFALFEDEVIKRRFGGERKEILDNAVETAGGAVPVRGQLLVAYDVSRALTHAVVEFDCDALVVGWHERQRTSEVVLGSNVDRLVRSAPCDVLVEKLGAEADGVESVLVPVAEGPHAAFATEVARAIAVANDARVDLLRVIGRDDERAAAEQLLTETAAVARPATVETRVERGDVTDAVVDAADDHDVTVMGTTRHNLVRRRLVGTVSQSVGRRSDSTVILARRPTGVRPRITRRIHEVL
jgi:nucleotide-binding universal stress UspA family protein